MFAARCLANRHAFAKNGKPAQNTTGVVNANCIQCNLRDVTIAIPARITGVLKIADHTKRFRAVTTRFWEGRVGYGVSKAREVPIAIQKSLEQARKNMRKVELKGDTMLILNGVIS